MARKITIQPAPIEVIPLDDETDIEIRDWPTRLIGRGLDKKFLADELGYQVLLGLIDDLQSACSVRTKRANTALQSNHALAGHMLDGGYEMDERSARRHAEKIRGHYRLLMRAGGQINIT